MGKVGEIAKAAVELGHKFRGKGPSHKGYAREEDAPERQEAEAQAPEPAAARSRSLVRADQEILDANSHVLAAAKEGLAASLKLAHTIQSSTQDSQVAEEFGLVKELLQAMADLPAVQLLSQPAALAWLADDLPAALRKISNDVRKPRKVAARSRKLFAVLVDYCMVMHMAEALLLVSSMLLLMAGTSQAAINRVWAVAHAALPAPSRDICPEIVPPVSTKLPSYAALPLERWVHEVVTFGGEEARAMLAATGMPTVAEQLQAALLGAGACDVVERLLRALPRKEMARLQTMHLPSLGGWTALLRRLPPGSKAWTVPLDGMRSAVLEAIKACKGPVQLGFQRTSSTATSLEGSRPRARDRDQFVAFVTPGIAELRDRADVMKQLAVLAGLEGEVAADHNTMEEAHRAHLVLGSLSAVHQTLGGLAVGVEAAQANNVDVSTQLHVAQARQQASSALMASNEQRLQAEVQLAQAQAALARKDIELERLRAAAAARPAVEAGVGAAAAVAEAPLQAAAAPTAAGAALLREPAAADEPAAAEPEAAEPEAAVVGGEAAAGEELLPAIEGMAGAASKPAAGPESAAAEGDGAAAAQAGQGGAAAAEGAEAGEAAGEGGGSAAGLEGFTFFKTNPIYNTARSPLPMIKLVTLAQAQARVAPAADKEQQPPN